VPPRVALATYAAAPGLAPDDRLLLPALERLGIDGVPAVWSDRTVAWREFDAVVLRSCWDYHLRFDEFQHWLRALERDSIRLWNPAPMVRWNSDKRYLLDLARRGAATIPTMIAARGHPEAVEAIAAAEGWRRFVVKPAVSASGYQTFALRTPLDATARSAIAAVSAAGDVLVQPFADEVADSGELSLTFFDGVFSHAAIKRARPGEFRVQTEHGGSVEAVTAEPRVVEQASAVLQSIDERPLYARVDGIARGDAFLLMELELIEPNVFMAYAPNAADRFATAIRDRLAESTK
jgi:glutathione synthase/RimK-type ligase-like ATP-grasp enzyme